jgi:glycopeptide antibiotics resistance protein
VTFLVVVQYVEKRIYLMTMEMEVLFLKKSMLFSSALSIILFSLFSPIIFQLTDYLHPIVVATVLLCLWAFITFIVLLIQKETISISYTTLLWFLSLYTFCLLVLLFFRPSNQSYGTYNLIPFSTIYFFLSGKVNLLISFYNLTANVVLFIPYGIFLRITGSQFTKAEYLVLPLVAISTIECLQYVTQRGSLDLDDLLLNLIGVFLGYLLFPVFKKVILISPAKKSQVL